MPTLSQFDTVFMHTAFAVSKLSKDPNTKVGAVLVLDNRQLSIGYNGFPTGVDEDDLRWQRPTKYEYVVHAEENAIINAPFFTAGCVLYVTHRPCHKCMGRMINAGIVRVYWSIDYQGVQNIEIWNDLARHFEFISQVKL